MKAAQLPGRGVICRAAREFQDAWSCVNSQVDTVKQEHTWCAYEPREEGDHEWAEALLVLSCLAWPSSPLMVPSLPLTSLTLALS